MNGQAAVIILQRKQKLERHFKWDFYLLKSVGRVLDVAALRPAWRQRDE